MVKVGIVGGTGYTGVELLRLLAAHPEVEKATLILRTHSIDEAAKVLLDAS